MTKFISSVQNPLIKEFLQLQEKSRIRKEKGVFVIEGAREILLAEKGNYTFEKILICHDFFDKQTVLSKDFLESKHNYIIDISKEVYQKISHRKTTEGIVAIVKSKRLVLSNLNLSKNPLILIAEAPEKPGNLGALLRTVDAGNLDAILIANPKTDIYNPNIIRSSVGCVFTTQIATGSTDEIISFLKDKKIAIYAAELNASVNYTEIDYTSPSAIAVGTESTGLGDKWIQHSTKNIIIPMRGEIDSLNVSVSAAIIIFEAIRQRSIL